MTISEDFSWRHFFSSGFLFRVARVEQGEFALSLVVPTTEVSGVGLVGEGFFFFLKKILSRLLALWL